jgi:hypothetical protein
MHLHFGSIGVRDLDVHKLPYYSNEDPCTSLGIGVLLAPLPRGGNQTCH